VVEKIPEHKLNNHREQLTKAHAHCRRDPQEIGIKRTEEDPCFKSIVAAAGTEEQKVKEG